MKIPLLGPTVQNQPDRQSSRKESHKGGACRWLTQLREIPSWHVKSASATKKQVPAYLRVLIAFSVNSTNSSAQLNATPTQHNTAQHTLQRLEASNSEVLGGPRRSLIFSYYR